jgi:RND family efflux transporter MFP subunit
MSEPAPPRLETDRRSAVRSVISFVLVLGILLFGIGIAILLFRTGPKADQTTEERAIPPVESMQVAIADFPVEIETQGSVEGRRETRIAAELSGRIIEVAQAFRQGGRVREGELLARIDPADFVAALAEARSTLADSELALAQEMARAEQAKVDWDRLGGTRAANPLALREPQIAAARARIEAARAAVSLAEQNLERTIIRAPFDAAVRETMIEVGAVTRPGEPIAELFTADDLEIRLPLTMEDYGFLKSRPDGSIDATITLTGMIGGREIAWQAEPARLDAEIDRRTLSAFLTARIFPNEGNGPAAYPPVGLFMNARVSGATLSNVAIIPRRAVREGGEVIIITSENRVEFRNVDVARTTRQHAIVRAGLSPGERLCLTRLNAPVTGMPVIDTTQSQTPE